MTLQQVLNVVHSATQIKKWPDEYRIYSPDGFALVYCDKNGQVTSFLVNMDGAVYVFNATEQKQVQSAIDVQKHKLKSKYTCFDRTQKTK